MIELIINILATYTIATIITQERGPMAIFSRLQAWLETKRPSQPDIPSPDATASEWKLYQIESADYLENDELFHSTLWGYAYALSSCAICLGAYAAAFVVLWQGGGLVAWLSAYGGHLILVKVIKE
jgi:hypothetical protein